MPNWTYNRLTVDPEYRSKDIFDFVAGKNTSFDFNNVIPMPKSLNIESSSVEEESIIIAYCKKYHNGIITQKNIEEFDKKYNTHFSWMTAKRVKKDFANADDDKCNKMLILGEIALNNLETYGHPDWYGWCNEHWGTKWNACDPDRYPDFISFDTAWNAPIPVMEELSRKFPDVKIMLWSHYEDGFITDYTWQNGKCIESYEEDDPDLEEEGNDG